MEVLFWIYLPVSVVASSGVYLILWSTLYVSPSHPFSPFSPHSTISYKSTN